MFRRSSWIDAAQDPWFGWTPFSTTPPRGTDRTLFGYASQCASAPADRARSIRRWLGALVQAREGQRDLETGRAIHRIVQVLPSARTAKGSRETGPDAERDLQGKVQCEGNPDHLPSGPHQTKTQAAADCRDNQRRPDEHSLHRRGRAEQASPPARHEKDRGLVRPPSTACSGA